MARDMSYYLSGIETTIDRLQLLNKLRANREEHVKIVEEAWEGYYKEAEKCLKAALSRNKKRDKSKVSVRMDVPMDFTKVYDQAIEMFERDESERITLNAQQFSHLVMNEWDWREQFIASASLYSSTAQSLS